VATDSGTAMSIFPSEIALTNGHNAVATRLLKAVREIEEEIGARDKSEKSSERNS
jgi:hypothetical protein